MINSNSFPSVCSGIFLRELKPGGGGGLTKINSAGHREKTGGVSDRRLHAFSPGRISASSDGTGPNRQIKFAAGTNGNSSRVMKGTPQAVNSGEQTGEGAFETFSSSKLPKVSYGLAQQPPGAAKSHVSYNLTPRI